MGDHNLTGTYGRGLMAVVITGLLALSTGCGNRTQVSSIEVSLKQPVPDLKEARRFSGDEGPACEQVLYHLQERAAEHDVIPWCEKHHCAFVAYSPFGHGGFPSPRTPGGRLLKEIADEHRATPRQVALRFLLRWPFSFAIPKASDVDHVIENAGAGDLELTAMQIERMSDRAD